MSSGSTTRTQGTVSLLNLGIAFASAQHAVALLQGARRHTPGRAAKAELANAVKYAEQARATIGRRMRRVESGR